MKRMVLPLVALFFVLSGKAAWAQIGFGPGTPGGYNRPIVPPILAIKQPGVNPIVGLGIANTQNQTGYNTTNIQQLQGVVTPSFLDPTTTINKPIMDTGNAARFQTSYRYFQTVYRTGGPGGAGTNQAGLGLRK